jgi:quercetin dioxygenase-like cupin family protein
MKPNATNATIATIALTAAAMAAPRTGAAQSPAGPPAAVQQGATVYTRDGVPLPVTNTGNNTLVELHRADSVFTFGMAVAAFPPGKRLAWHHHPGGQILVITEGVGYYQERGQPRRTVRKGEVITCAPGVEHWHGASVEAGVTYLASSPAHAGPTVWGQPVTDDEYNGRPGTRPK